MKIKHAKIRFIGALNDFLSPAKKNEIIPVQFKGRQSIKHIIESQGVPHPEVEKIRVDNQYVNPSYLLKDNDEVEVYPWYDYSKLFEIYQIKPCFILDNHLGKLAVYLRMLGYDTLYENNFQDDEIINLIKSKGRIILTRDRRLLMRREVRYGYCVRQDDPKKQIIEIVDLFKLRKWISPLKRCLKCNHLLTPIDKLSIIHRLEPLTKLYYEEFHICPNCHQIYWKGTHYNHMLELIDQIKSGVLSQ